MSIEEVWAIGLFEGEGSIIIQRSCNSAYLTVSMTDLDVINRLQQVWGGKIYLRKNQNPKWKQAWRWQLGGKNRVKKVLNRMLPFLSERRACKALDALDRIDGCYSEYQGRD